jgi:hypothetical protein
MSKIHVRVSLDEDFCRGKHTNMREKCDDLKQAVQKGNSLPRITNVQIVES